MGKARPTVRLRKLAARQAGTKCHGRGRHSCPAHLQSPQQPSRPMNKWGHLFTTHPQTTPHECHGMTSLTTPHLSYALATSAKCPDTHLPCKSSQIPALTSKLTPGTDGHILKRRTWEGSVVGRDTPPTSLPAKLWHATAACCKMPSRAKPVPPPQTSIKDGPEPLSITRFS